ncbi:hypothetical protein, partial [Acrocarpospora catenulata]|uniref:hypothetical protein n=1 Tax=Acrocarpospora catenulata TaxID=2836182 RepID=UPI001BDA7733
RGLFHQARPGSTAPGPSASAPVQLWPARSGANCAVDTSTAAAMSAAVAVPEFSIAAVQARTDARENSCACGEPAAATGW